MNKKIILHIDMNSYFASVEQQANPFLRGKPIGVCAYLSPGGCIIASSMEAKKKGIKTGCLVRDAQRLDPSIVLLENEPAKYRSTTQRIFKIFTDYTDTVEPYSIDEAFLDLSGFVNSWEKAELIGREIQARIKKEVGEWLNSSVGISWTRWLAKFTSDIALKKGLLMINTKMGLSEILKDRPLQDAWGINTRTERRLRVLGIKNLWELKYFPESRIKQALGWYGYYLWANVNGEEISRVSQGAPRSKSIGHSYCVPKKTTDKSYLDSVLYKLCEKTGRRLRDSGREAQGINVYFAYTRGGGVGRSWKTSSKMFTSEEVYAPAGRYLESIDLLMPVRMIAVSVTRLSSVSSQMSLFEDNLSKKDLSRALDNINNKYGEYTVVKGRMFNTNEIAQDRIGFRKTINIE